MGLLVNYGLLIGTTYVIEIKNEPGVRRAVLKKVSETQDHLHSIVLMPRWEVSWIAFYIELVSLSVMKQNLDTRL